MKPNLPAAIVIVLCLLAPGICWAQQDSDAISARQLKSRLDAQAAEIAELRQRLEQRESQVVQTAGAYQIDCGDKLPDSKSPVRRLPLVMEDFGQTAGKASDDADSFTLDYYPDYDQGFVIRPFQPSQHPFELRVSARVRQTKNLLRRHLRALGVLCG